MGPVNLPFDSSERAEQFREVLDSLLLVRAFELRPLDKDNADTAAKYREEMYRKLYRYAFSCEFQIGFAAGLAAGKSGA